LSPAGWTAPPWVIQEAGYAQRAGLKLLIFRERGVEIPGLQGDLEYIEFVEKDYAEAFRKSNEMILREIGKRSGVVVETAVHVVPTDAANREPIPEVVPTEQSSSAPSELEPIHTLFTALYEKRFEDAEVIYNLELDRLAREEPERVVRLRAFSYRWRFAGGVESSLDDLRNLAAEYPADPIPFATIADCLNNYREYDSAAASYLQASQRAEPERGAGYRLSAARAFKDGKRISDARELLLSMANSDVSEFRNVRGEVLKELYEVFKALDQPFHASVIGEMILHENPGFTGLRFQLAYDYDEWTRTNLSIHHYTLLTEKHPEYGAAVLNLGVVYSKRELDILAVQCYQKALSLSETLGAKNLANKYLRTGMVSEATELIKTAMADPTADPTLSEVLVSAERKRGEESEKLETAEKSSQKHREFSLAFFGAMLDSLRVIFRAYGTFLLPR